jgi:hypothetical protein
LTLLALTGSGPGGLRFIDTDKVEYAAPCAPTICLGVLSLSDRGHSFLVDQSEALNSLGASHSLQPTRIAADASALNVLAATNLLKRLQEQAEAIASYARELSALRARHEETQNAFAELESHVDTLELQPIRLAFENLPSDYPPVGGLHVATLSQKLPVDVFGLSALDVHLDSPLDSASPGVEIALRTIEDTVEHGRWRFFSDQLAAGWLSLQLPRAVGGTRRTAELVFSALDQTDRLPLFSVGPPLPHCAFRVQSPKGPQSLGALAFRAWKGLPGVRPPSLPSLTTMNDVATGVIERRIPVSIIESVVPIHGSWQPDFDILEPRPAVGGFLCHPGPDGLVTVAGLDGLDFSRPCLLSTTAILESDKSAPVEFAIAFSDRQEGQVVEFINSSESRREMSDFVFSGWRQVVHGKPAFLSVAPKLAKGRPYFATRMAEGSPQWFAWAVFSDITQVFLGESAEVVEATDAATDPHADEASERVALWLASEREVADRTRHTIICSPPLRGICVRRLPQIDLNDGLQLRANISVAAGDGAQVDFGLAISNLGPNEVATLAGSAAFGLANDRLIFSGWRDIDSRTPSDLSLDSRGWPASRAHVFLLTRLHGLPPVRALPICTFSHFSIDLAAPIKERK